MKLIRFLFAIFTISLLSGCSFAAPRISIEWTTASEVNTAGFNVYRGENPAGPFARVNTEIVPTMKNSLVGGTYRFEDASIVYDKVYYYLLEDIEVSGAIERNGPISATAQNPINPNNVLFAGPVTFIASILGLRIKQILSP